MTEFELQADGIQYVPHHTCPRCGAKAIPRHEGGTDWLTYFYKVGKGDSTLDLWASNIAYARFACNCLSQHDPTRFAVVDNAIIDLPFVRQTKPDPRALEKHNPNPYPFIFEESVPRRNVARVRQAVHFLLEHAKPTQRDPLLRLLEDIALDEVSPETAQQLLESGVANEHHR